MRRGPIMIFFGLSCVCPLWFLQKYTEFHYMRTECQRIITTDYSHTFIAIAKHFPILYLLLNLHSPIAPRSNRALV